MNKYLNKNLIILIIAFLLGGLFMYFLLRFTPLISTIVKDGNYVIIKDKTKIYDKSSLSRSIEKVYDATVLISSHSYAAGENTGSGFIYKTDDKYGYIMTNEHVISGSSKIDITLSTDENIESELLGKDAYLDLAILRIDKKYVKQVVNIGSSEKIKLGDTIFTVGTPIGANYRGSVTSGIISGKDRMVTVTTSESNNNDWVLRVIQVDASINPGNSGGPLVNINGEVIGICSMKMVDDNVEGMAFAIPIEYATSHVESLEKGKEINWPSLGVDVVNVTDTTSLLNSGLTINNDIKEGAVITKVKDKTGAKKANLKVGDIIIKVNNKQVNNTASLRYELYQYKAGDVVDLTIIRNGKEKVKKVKLGKK